MDVTGSLLKRNPPPQLDHANYLKVRFWTETEWKTWRATTAERQQSSQYTSFLEDDDGKPLPSKRIGDILQTAQDLWHELCKRKFIDLDTTWTSMSASAKWNFRDEVTRACPELNLGEDLWKSDMLGKKNYGSFKQTWFTNRADDKVSSSGKRKVKKESVDSVDLPKSKCAHLSPSPSPDDGNSNINDSNTQIPTSISASSASSSSIQSVSGPHTPSIPSLHYAPPEADDFGQIYDFSGTLGDMCTGADADARAPGEKICKE